MFLASPQIANGSALNMTWDEDFPWIHTLIKFLKNDRDQNHNLWNSTDLESSDQKMNTIFV